MYYPLKMHYEIYDAFLTIFMILSHYLNQHHQGAVSIRKTVLPGMSYL